MADQVKLQKLAAARKKLKGYQQGKNKNIAKQENSPIQCSSPADSVTSTPETQPEPPQPSIIQYSQQQEHIVQYPQQPPIPYPQQEPIIPYPQQEPIIPYSQQEPITQYSQQEPNIQYPQQEPAPQYPQQEPINQYASPQEFNIQYVPTQESQAQIQTYFHQSNHPYEVEAPNFFDIVTNNQPETMNNSNQSDNNKISEENKEFAGGKAMDYPEIEQNEVYNFSQGEVLSLTDSDKNENSPTESLRQLSMQINKLIEPAYDNQDNFSDLEKRNLELASLYESEKLKNEQSLAELEEYKSRVAVLEKNLEEKELESRSYIQRELGPLQEQLQSYTQTVGILVGEKSELSATLSQCHLETKQKIAECEELSGRLKASRSRAADLEKELNNLKEEKMKFSNMGLDHNKELEKMREELVKLREENVEAKQDVTELREKLRMYGEENAKLQQSGKDLSNQLELAKVKIQQLSIGEYNREDSQVEMLVQEKLQLEKQIQELSNNLNSAVNERDQASNQYQQYVQQLNVNITNLAQKLDTTLIENENLAKREQDLIRHIGELEKRLQTLQNEHLNVKPISKPNTDLENELQLSQTNYNNLQSKHDQLQEKFNDLIVERDEMIKEVAERKEALTELEGKMERLQGNQTDSSRLLAAIESDKVAASRAVQQNSELKQQLEEMQEAFIKMTNDKAEFVDKLTTEQYKTKELEERIHQLEHQLHTLSEAIQIKDKELTEIRNNSTDLNKHEIQQNQLSDRLHHYETQERTSQSIISQQEKEIEHLKNENKKLLSQDNEDLLQKEIFDLKQNLDKLKSEKDELLLKLSSTANCNGVEIHDENIHDINKEMAMRQLEKKFMNTMQDIANLQDEKQMLEHIVLQLQGETETIGEYIALYQHQRGVLKQRAQEKEVQLKQLSKDREDVKQQLNRLNDLVRTLVLKKDKNGDVLKEVDELCEEHAKLHKEIQEDESVKVGGEETAKEIISLLSEIKSSNLVQPADVSEAFHPCPWCSGQLITV